VSCSKDKYDGPKTKDQGRTRQNQRLRMGKKREIMAGEDRGKIAAKIAP